MVCPADGRNDANVERVNRHDRDRHGSTAGRLSRLQERAVSTPDRSTTNDSWNQQTTFTTGECRANARNNVPLGVKLSDLAVDDLIGVDVIGMGVEDRSKSRELYCSMN